MKFFRLSLSLMCLILVGCTNPDPEPKKNEKVALAAQVSKECAQTLSKRYGMSQSGQGGKMMYEIEGLYLAFDIYRSISKEEAREMLIDCAHEVITTVNHNPAIQKHLLPGGFNKKSVQIQIYIKPDHQKNYSPNLGVCSYNFGKLAYSTYDPENKYKYKTSERETYEEAIVFLESSNRVSCYKEL